MRNRTILISLLLMQACSTANFYEGARQNRQLECRKLQGSQYEECMQQHEDDYQSYHKKLEEVK